MNANSEVVSRFEEWVDSLKYRATQVSGLYDTDTIPPIKARTWADLLPVFLKLKPELTTHEPQLVTAVQRKHQYHLLLDLVKWNKVVDSLGSEA